MTRCCSRLIILFFGLSLAGILPGCSNCFCEYQPDETVAGMGTEQALDPAQAVALFQEKIKAKKFDEAYILTVPGGVGNLDPVKGPGHLKAIFDENPYALDLIACSRIKPGYTIVTPRRSPTFASVALHFRKTYYLFWTYELTPKDFQMTLRRLNSEEPWRVDLDELVKTLNKVIPKMLGKKEPPDLQPNNPPR